jgi:hypothetical protein
MDVVSSSPPSLYFDSTLKSSLVKEGSNINPGHFRLLVRAWCSRYVSSQGTKRSAVNVVVEDRRLAERCACTYIYIMVYGNAYRCGSHL